MKLQNLLLATAVVGVVFNIYDFVVHGLLLAGTYEGIAAMRTDTPLIWMIVGDFVFALVFVWFYDRVYDSFGGGTAGGARFGMYLGVVMAFPAMLFMPLMIVGFPYGLGWVWVATTIIAGVIGGAVAGTVYRKEAPAS